MAIIQEDMTAFADEQLGREAKIGTPVTKEPPDLLDLGEELKEPHAPKDQNLERARLRLRHMFGSTSINVLRMRYIYEALLPCVNQIFRMRLNLKPSQEDVLRRIIEAINDIVPIAQNKKHKERMQNILKVIRKNPDLENLQQRNEIRDLVSDIL